MTVGREDDTGARVRYAGLRRGRTAVISECIVRKSGSAGQNTRLGDARGLLSVTLIARCANPAGSPATTRSRVEMLTDMTPAAAGQLYPQLQSIAKSPVHGHVVSLRSVFPFVPLFSSFNRVTVPMSIRSSSFPPYRISKIATTAFHDV